PVLCSCPTRRSSDLPVLEQVGKVPHVGGKYHRERQDCNVEHQGGMTGTLYPRCDHPIILSVSTNADSLPKPQGRRTATGQTQWRSEEHTSELQSRID